MKNEYNDYLDSAAEQASREDVLRARQQLQEMLARLKLPKVPLLVHDEPKPYENYESFLYRCAEKNGLKSAAELQRALKLPVGKALSPKRHEQLSGSLGGDLTAIAQMLPTAIGNKLVQYGTHTLARHHLALTTSRLCPACIAVEPYGRRHWDLAPFAVCEKHGVYLIDQCSCNRQAPLNKCRPRYEICSCGADLRRAATSEASPAGKRLSQEVYRLFTGVQDGVESNMARDQLSVPRGTSLGGLLDLITFIGAIHPVPQTMNLALARPLMRMAPVIAQFERAAGALSDWPNGMLALLRTAVCPNAKGKRGVARVYEGLRHVTIAAERRLPLELNKWFLDAVSVFLETPAAWNPMPVFP